MRVLIQCGDVFENVRRVLSLAALLRDHGAEPLVSTYTDRWDAFFAAHGVRTAPFYPFRNRLAASDAAWRFDFDVDLDDQIALDVARAALAGERADVARLRAAALQATVAADRLVRETAPDALIVWNGRTGAVANAWRRLKTARALPGGFIERGLVPNAVIFDPAGANGESTLAAGPSARRGVDADALVARHGAALERWFGRGAGPAPAPSRARAALLAPLQVQRDSNVVLHSRRVRSMRRFVVEALALRDAVLPGWIVEARRHPEEDPAERLNLPMAAGLRRADDGPLRPWLRSAPVVVTLNSAVGLEAAMEGCAVVVLGEGVYCREDFVLRVDGQDGVSGLRGRIEAILDDPAAQAARIDRYLAWLLDARQTLPAGAGGAAPSALLAALGLGVRAPDDPVPSDPTLAETLRRTLPREGALQVDVVDLADVRLPLSYRAASAPLDEAAIRAGLATLVGSERTVALRATDAPGRADVAIAPRGRRFSAFEGYAAVLDETFAPHPEWRPRIATAGGAARERASP